VTATDPTRGVLDPGNAGPESWAEPISDAELAELLGLLANPDPLVTAGLAGTLYDPEFTGPGDLGDLGELDGDQVPRGLTEAPAPAHVDQMRAWVALGGGNSGIMGNRAHTYGFHRGGIVVPASDYSRRRDPRGTNLSTYSGGGRYCCAGDYHHGARAALRARHAVLLTRLMDGDDELDNVCEFIGKPWPDRPVYYWARWNGLRVLQRYTGSGHDLWSHVAVWRSDAVDVPTLWAPATAAAPNMVPVSRVTTTLKAPAWKKRKPNYFRASSSAKYAAPVRAWQARMRQRGWPIKVDGYYGPDAAAICRKFQDEKRLGVDGLLGPATFAAAWTSKVTK
jgi:hypothetical protein